MRVGSFGLVVRALVLALAGALPAASGCSSHSSSDTHGKKSGLCAPVACAEGAPCGCVGMDPACDCRLCQLFGECQPLPGLAVKCAPASADDCNRPDGSCATFGACALGSGASGPMCVPGGEDDCRASAECAMQGVCSLIPDFPEQCFVDSDDDCAASLVCRDVGCCVMREGECRREDGSCPSKCCGSELCE